jgi:hypothetical protein
MTQPDDPRRVFQKLMIATLAYDRKVGNRVIDMLGVTGVGDRESIHALLLAYALQYRFIRLGEVARPGGREIIDALNLLAHAAGQIDGALTVLRCARQTANQGCGDAEDIRWALFPLVTDAFQRAMRIEQSEWHGGLEDPLAGGFGDAAVEIRALTTRFEVADVREPTRSQHPAMTELIGSLGALYRDRTGRPASAQQPGDRPDYCSPFVRFVRTFAPLAGVESDLPTKTIARALSLYARLPRNSGVIRRTDDGRDPCHLSVDQHETARDDDHEA